MKRELNDQKKKEVDKYLQILRQEDQKYDFESTNGNKLEREIIKMYKKWNLNALICIVNEMI